MATACPVCNTPLSETRYAEIQEKIRLEERAQYEEARQTFEAEAQGRLADAFRQGEEQAKEVEAQAAARFSIEREHLRVQLVEFQNRETEIALKHENEIVGRVAEAQSQLRSRHDEELAAIKGREQNLVSLIERLQADQRSLGEAHQRELEARSVAVERDVRSQLQVELESSRRTVESSAEQLRELQLHTSTLAEKHRRELDQHLAELKAREAESVAAVRQEQAAQLSSLQTDRDALAEQLRSFQRNLAAAREEHELKIDLLRAESERAQLEELAKQRALLDQVRAQELAQYRAEVAAREEGLRKKLHEVERKLEQQTAHELGHWPEVNLAQSLREAFPDDEIRSVSKGEKGADIIHSVRYKGEICGRIAIDSKNRLQWRESFVDKLAEDQLNADAQHAILSTAVFPQGFKDLSIRRDVILAKPNQLVAIVDLLRRTIISNYLLGLSRADEGRKKDRLYQLITSDLYRQQFRSAEKLCERLLQLDADEYAAHMKVWENRGKSEKQLERLLRDINASMLAIIESNQSPPVEAHPAVDMSALPEHSILRAQAP